MADVSTRQGRRRPEQRIARATPASQTPVPSTGAPKAVLVEPDRRHALICEAAYFRAERRGFCPGRELDDWLAAEGEIDRDLRSGAGS